MPHSPNRPEVDRQALACRPGHFPVGPHRLPNRAGRPASCVAVSRPRRGYGRRKDFAAIPPATEVAGFLARGL